MSSLHAAEWNIEYGCNDDFRHPDKIVNFTTAAVRKRCKRVLQCQCEWMTFARAKFNNQPPNVNKICSTRVEEGRAGEGMICLMSVSIVILSK